MRIIRRRIEGKKCGGCNYATVFFYGFEGDNLHRLGLCANCFLDLTIIELDMGVMLDYRKALLKGKKMIQSFYKTAKAIKDRKMIDFCEKVFVLYREEGL